ncbi:MAG: esterase-like activity of phytase family protein [Planctomycetota bacterium]
MDPDELVFHYAWEGNIDQSGLAEPSGLVYHPAREALFAVGDEGHIAHMQTDGSDHEVQVLQDGADLEGITLNPASGLLYVAVEGQEKVLEVDPDSLEIVRKFQIDREFRGETVFKPEGNGTEGITFRPDESHPEGGTFYVTNQSFGGDEESFIMEVELPLESGGQTGRNLRMIKPGVIDLSALYRGPGVSSMLVVSDATNSIYRLNDEGEVVDGWAFVGNDQEGLALGPDGYMYIAQDSGGIIKVWPKTLRGPKDEQGE